MEKVIRQISLSLALLLLMLSSSGCLGYEKQTLVLFFSKDGKEIHGLLIYEGLLVQSGTPGQPANERDLEKAVEDLKALVQGDAISFMNLGLAIRKTKDQEGPVLSALELLAASKGQFLLGKNSKITYCQPIISARIHPSLLPM